MSTHSSKGSVTTTVSRHSLAGWRGLAHLPEVGEGGLELVAESVSSSSTNVRALASPGHLFHPSLKGERGGREKGGGAGARGRTGMTIIHILTVNPTLAHTAL